jgi:branched-chain amino acid transport system substrate-binding protein
LSRVRTAALGLALAASAAGIASAQSKGTIKIASQTPLSGPQSVLGEAIKNGAQLAIEKFGGLVTAQGFRLVFQPEDDQATPNVGVSNANRLINDAQILGIVGHLNSGVAIPSSEVYAKVGLPMVSPANTNPAVTDRESTRAVTNRVCGRDDVQGPAGADFVVNTLKAKKLYVLNDKTPYGQGLADAFAKRAKELKATIAFETGVNSNETDFSSIINRALVDKPDAIFFGAIYSQAGPFVKQLREKGLKTAVVGGDGFDSSDLQKLAGAANLTNVFFTTTSGPIASLPAAKQFAADYQKKFNKAPEGYSAYGYDSARVVITAIANAIKANGGKAPTREQVAAEVRKVKFQGVTGAIEFNARGDLKSAKYFVIEPHPSDYTKNSVKSSVSAKAPTD